MRPHSAQDQVRDTLGGMDASAEPSATPASALGLAVPRSAGPRLPPQALAPSASNAAATRPTPHHPNGALPVEVMFQLVTGSHGRDLENDEVARECRWRCARSMAVS